MRRTYTFFTLAYQNQLHSRRPVAGRHLGSKLKALASTSMKEETAPFSLQTK
jgi:hypothetical protein